MLPVISIGPASLPVPGLIVILSLWVGLSLAEKFAQRFKIQPEIIVNSFGLGLLCGLLGARLSYVAVHIDAFIRDPLAVISINYQLLDFWGGLLLACMAVFVYGQRKGVNWRDYINAITPAMAVFFVALPLAELASGENYGMPTNLPWAINLWESFRHPTQVYDFLASGAILVWLLAYVTRSDVIENESIFLLFVFLTALSRVILDGFEASPDLFLGRFRSGQVGSWILMTSALITLYLVNRKKKSILP
jgi:phosphatidylglycerol---prolipoprotein diacylglyceryl transferase